MRDTSRHLIFFHPSALSDTAKVLSDSAGISIPSSIEEASIMTASQREASDTIILPSLGVAISSAAPEQITRLNAGGANPIRNIRKERIFQIASLFSDVSLLSKDFLRGYQAGVNNFISELLGFDYNSSITEVLDGNSYCDNDTLTWGLQALGISQCRFTGKGVRVAILDTGYDLLHPDFLDRNIQSKSFIDGIATAQDDNTHGTHCLGTFAGPRIPSKGPRYGVAGDAEIFVGKVMSADGKGREGDILHGIEWALENECRIVSLSLGKMAIKSSGPENDYEEIGRAALNKNCLIIAAAGNDSVRPGTIAPVNIPANSSTIMAVGAIDRRMSLYNKSNGGLIQNGGNIDLVAPGVDVLSSKIQPLIYGLDSGTSMATPHVSGVAALLMEADPQASAEQIWARLTQQTKRLQLASVDVGSGLVQAPN